MMYILLFISLFIIQLAYFRIANYFNIIDKPNERSSHTQVTLRGGGVVFYFAALLFFIFCGFQYPWFVLGLTLISLISFADDVKPQSSRIRLLIHFVAMGLMFYQWNLFSLPWYFTIIALIVCTGILNAYNFMDGINGITGGYSMVVVCSLLYINKYSVSFVDSNLLYIILLGLIVFNYFNFRRKARCFAGDVGSVSIAFIIVFLLGLLILKTANLNYMVILAVYGVDSVLTIIHRLFLRENIFKPHRKHVFQLMANELRIPHLIVSAFYAFVQLIIVFGFIFLNSDSYIYTCSVIGGLMLLYVLFKVKYFKLHKF